MELWNQEPKQICPFWSVGIAQGILGYTAFEYGIRPSPLPSSPSSPLPLLISAGSGANFFRKDQNLVTSMLHVMAAQWPDGQLCGQGSSPTVNSVFSSDSPPRKYIIIYIYTHIHTYTAGQYRGVGQMSGVSGHALRARPEPLRRCGAKKKQKDLSVRTCHILKSGFFAGGPHSRLPLCIVAYFMHGGQADSRANVQSTAHDYE